MEEKSKESMPKSTIRERWSYIQSGVKIEKAARRSSSMYLDFWVCQSGTQVVYLPIYDGIKHTKDATYMQTRHRHAFEQIFFSFTTPNHAIYISWLHIFCNHRVTTTWILYTQVQPQGVATILSQLAFPCCNLNFSKY